MQNKNEWFRKLGEQVEILVAEPMKNHTTFRIGGPADALALPKTPEEVAEVVRFCNEHAQPYYVLGNGSNLLVSDEGYRGLVLQLYRNFNDIQVNGETITVQSGAMLAAVARTAYQTGLTGLEFASGIPGTIGGAVVMNAGAYVTGSQLMKLGEYYAKAIHDTYGLDFDVLFGPAYKGIPLTVATTIAISKLYGKDIRYCSNRKEVKDHGDTGILLGSKLKDGDKVVIIEDVTTSGKSIEETFPILKAQADVEVIGLMVSLNRMEVGKGGEKSALDEIKELYGIEANAIVSMAEVTEHLYNKECGGRVVIDDRIKSAIDAYYEQYGALA